MREMGLSFVTVAAQGFYRSRVRNCYPLPNKRQLLLQLPLVLGSSIGTVREAKPLLRTAF